MSFSINKQLTIIIILIIFIVWMISVIMISIEYKGKCSNYLDHRDEVFDNAIDGVVRTYESFSNFIFISAIDNDLIKGYLFTANHGDEEVKAAMRKQLAQELETTHRLITEYNFRQFHFQLANGDSFYRFHSPEKFGDNLLNVRESMRVANVEKRYIAGFEEGRIFSGYRFVYPLNHKGEHVGSIEISISPQCILEELYALDSQRDLGFILSKDVMESIVFDDQQVRYKDSFISDEYVSDVEVSSLIDERQDGLKLHQNPVFINKLKELIGDDLHNKNSVSTSMSFDSKKYLVQYRLINDISNCPVGYFFSFKEDCQIQANQTAGKTVLTLATVTMAFLVLLVTYAYMRQKEMHRLAMIDQLTNIYNRHSFYLLAEREIARSERNEETISIGMIDIDFFKKVNDSYGHVVGDEVLKAVAKIVKESIRETDVLARYGGEEFVLLMPATTIRNAPIVAERIRANIEANYFNMAGKITVSIGVVERMKKEKIDAAINRADEALYQAKETGRNKIVCDAGETSVEK